MTVQGAGLQSLRDLRGVGPALAERLAEMDIRTPADLTATFPRAYKDWRVPTPIGEIVRAAVARGIEAKDAPSTEEIAVGTIRSLREFRGRVAVVSAELEDATGRLRVSWFGRRGLAGRLAIGDRIFVHGRVALKRSRTAGTTVEMNVLSHRMLDEGEEYRGRIVPVYRASQEVPSRTIAAIFERNEAALAALVRDVMPAEVERKHGYPTLSQAWRDVHFPRSMDAAGAARERLLFEQFFGLALAAALKRARRDAEGGAQPMTASRGLLDEFARALPFALTGAQWREIAAIYADMARGAPMNRLLQGDVGSGKTLVAAAAVVLAARSGAQSAFMAPTEILAAQHARKLAPLLLPFGIRVDAFFGSQGARSRAEARGAARERRVRTGGRHPRAADRGRRLSKPRPRRHRRAAPLRRAATGQAACQEPRAAYALYDRDADPAHARAVALCGSRPVGARRVAPGPDPGRDLRVAREPQGARPTSSSCGAWKRAARPTSSRPRSRTPAVRTTRRSRAPSRSTKRCARGRSRGCASPCCTAACRRARRTTSWGVSRAAKSTC